MIGTTYYKLRDKNSGKYLIDIAIIGVRKRKWIAKFSDEGSSLNINMIKYYILKCINTPELHHYLDSLELESYKFVKTKSNTNFAAIRNRIEQQEIMRKLSYK